VKRAPVWRPLEMIVAYNTWPPWLVQSSAEAVGTQPWPLHAFWPLQALLVVLHELVPLQALMPEH